MRCILCGTNNASCGQPTVSVPIDATIQGRVIHDKVIPHGDTKMMMPDDLNDEEREEFRIMSRSYAERKLRNQVMMNEGEAGHTALVYVRKPDGIITKMTAEVADEYVALNPTAEIVKRGTMPMPVSGDIFGATKAGVGEMFGADGRQLHDVQPMTTRTFMAGSDDVNPRATSPTLSHTAPASREETSSLSDEQKAAALSPAKPASAPKAAVPKPAE